LKKITPEAPGGFCTACLLRDAEEEKPLGQHAAASIEQISAAFPRFEVLEFIGQGGMALWFYGICLSSFLVLVNFIYIGLCLSRMKPLAVWLTLAACLLLYFGVRYANYCYIHMNY